MPLDLKGMIKEGWIVRPSVRQGNPSGYECRIRENAKDGKMLLNVAVPDDSCYSYVNLPPTKRPYFVENKRCADAVVWQRLADHLWRLHIFELKKTIYRNLSNWDGDVKQQFHGAYLHCRMMADLIGVEIDRHVLPYTVFHQRAEEDIEASDTDMLLERPLTDLPDRVPSLQAEWNSNRCEIRQFGWPDHFEDLIFQHHSVHITGTNSESVPMMDGYALEPVSS